MKKQLTTVFLVLVLLLTATGCTVANAAERNLAAKPETVPAATPAQSQPAPSETLSVPAATQPVTAEAPRALTKEQAQQIALDHLGITADQVRRMRTEYEIDDGIAQYDVQFLQGDWEYEFEIHAETGKILSYDKDHKYD